MAVQFLSVMNHSGVHKDYVRYTLCDRTSVAVHAVNVPAGLHRSKVLFVPL